jgi:DNA-directed RNA polymerase specialized sigma24 family protein
VAIGRRSSRSTSRFGHARFVWRAHGSVTAMRTTSPKTRCFGFFSRASEFTPGRPCLPWFYAIVANEIQTERRRRSHLADDGVPQNHALDADDADTQLVARELERALDLATEELDEDGAQAINAVLGRAPLPYLSAATFRNRVSRAYAKLRNLLGGHDVR